MKAKILAIIVFQFMVNSMAFSLETIVFDDFNQGWEWDTYGGSYWGRNNYSGMSTPPKAWVLQDGRSYTTNPWNYHYPNSIPDVAMYREFDLSNYTSPAEIQFDYYVNTESGGDYLKVFINGTQQVWSISGTGKEGTKTIDISSYIGSTVSVKFSFSSNSSVNYPCGVLIDNFYLRATPNPPNITLTPSSHDYGEILKDDCSSTYSFTLKNTGGGTATGSVYLTGGQSSQFTITSGSGSFSLGHNTTKTIKVKFCPTATGSKSTTLKADGTSPCNDVTSSLSGTGVQPVLSLTPASYNFGDIETGQCSSPYNFILKNTGTGTATGSVYLAGGQTNQFTITSGSGSFSLGHNATKTIKVKFCPTSTGSKSTTLKADGSNCGNVTSLLTGTGMVLPPDPIVTSRSVSPLNITLGDNFEVSIAGRNDGSIAEHGGFSISFPQITYLGLEADVVPNSATIIPNFFEKGYYPIATVSGNATADYLLAEGEEQNWAEGESKDMRLTVTPLQTGTFDVNLRMWLTTDGYSNVYRDPTSGSIDPQQGWYVFHYTVIVNPPKPDLTVLNVTIDENNVTRGDSVTIRTEVKNIGKGASSTFFIHTYLTIDHDTDPDDADNVHLGGDIYGTLNPDQPLTYAIKVPVPSDATPATYYACAFVDYNHTNDESNEGNNIGLSNDQVDILSNVGNLNFYVKNEHDNLVSGAYVKIYSEDFQYAWEETTRASGSPAQFENIPIGRRDFEVLNHVTADENQEYWGYGLTDSVRSDVGIAFTYPRGAPYMDYLRPKDDNGDDLVSNGSDQYEVSPKQTIQFEMVANGSLPQAHDAKLLLYLDRDQSSPFDWNDSCTITSFSNAGSHTFQFDVPQEATNGEIYHVKTRIEIYRVDAWHQTDYNDWNTPCYPLLVNADDTPPTVTSVSPENGAPAVPISSELYINFSKPIKESTINTSNVKLVCSEYLEIVDGAFTKLTASDYKFTPNEDLSYGVTYACTLKTSIKDLAGNGLDGNGNGVSEGSPTDDYVWSFTTYNPQGQVLDVPYYHQSSYSWCWAASASMLLKYYGINRKVWEIAAYYDKPPNGWLAGAGGSTVHDYLSKFFTNVTFDTRWTKSGVINFLKEKLSEGKPVWLGSTSAHHAIVVVGTSSDYVYINDPSGAFHEKGLDEFPKESLSQDSLCSYKMIWERFSSIISNWLLLDHCDLVCIEEIPGGEQHTLSLEGMSENAHWYFRNGLGNENHAMWIQWDGRPPYEGYYFEPIVGAEFYHTYEPTKYALTRTDAVSFPTEKTGMGVVNAGQDSVTCKITIEMSSSLLTSNVFQIPPKLTKHFYSFNFPDEENLFWLSQFAPGNYTMTFKLIDETDVVQDSFFYQIALTDTDYAYPYVRLISDSSQTIYEGNEAVYVFTIKNKGTLLDSFALKSDKGSFCLSNGTPVDTLIQNVNKEDTLYLKVIESYTNGQPVSFNAKFKSQLDPIKNRTFALSITVLQGKKGDVNEDTAINVLDLVRTVNIILGKPPVPTNYELFAADVAPLVAGNPVGDSAVNILDVVALAYYITHNEWPGGKGVPTMVTVRPKSIEVRSEKQGLSIINNQLPMTNNQIQAVLSVGDGKGMLGSAKNPVDITLENEVPVGGIQFTLSFDSLLYADSIALTNHISHMTPGYNIWDDSIKVLVYSASGDSILPDSVPILRVFFSVDSEAVEGDSSLLQVKNCILSDPQAQPVSCESQDGWFYFKKVGTEEEALLPRKYELSEVFPNPATGIAIIKYAIPKLTHTTLKIYDISGKLVKMLVDETKKPAYYSITWNGRDNRGKKLASGIYFAKFKAGDFKATKKLILVR